MRSWTQSSCPASKPVLFFFLLRKVQILHSSPKLPVTLWEHVTWARSFLVSPHSGMSSIPMLQGSLGHYQLPAFSFLWLQRPCHQPALSTHPALLAPAPTVWGLYIHVWCVRAGRCTCPLPPTARLQGPNPRALTPAQLSLLWSSLSFPTVLSLFYLPCLPPSSFCVSSPAPEQEANP